VEEFDITRLVPKFILDDRIGFALAMAIQAGVREALDQINEGVMGAMLVDSMTDAILDETAEDIGITWWTQDATIEEKRQTIKDSYSVLRHLGTPAAILYAINGAFGTGRVEEWTAYDGEPYHFRVYTTNAEALTDNYEKFVRIVNAVKNVRSVLDGVYYVGAGGEAHLWTATAAHGAYGRTAAGIEWGN
jgi:P2-related tail formation protein